MAFLVCPDCQHHFNFEAVTKESQGCLSTSTDTVTGCITKSLLTDRQDNLQCKWRDGAVKQGSRFHTQLHAGYMFICGISPWS